MPQKITFKKILKYRFSINGIFLQQKKAAKKCHKKMPQKNAYKKIIKYKIFY